jgi:hypothetical protein
MAYIGKEPGQFFTSFVKQDFTTSATTSYTLDHPVANGNEIALFINFVRQEPTAAYTASGTSLTLTSATSASDDMYCVYLGKALQTVNPPNSSVGSSQVSADLITGQTALGATPADTDELLISDAGTLKRVDFSYLKSSNTPAFTSYLSSNQNFTSDTLTKVQFNTEVFDSNSAYDNSTNYRFTVPSGEAGKYFIFSQIVVTTASNNASLTELRIYKNGSNFVGREFSTLGSTILRRIPHEISYIDDASVGDYYEIYGNNNGTSPYFESGAKYCVFGAYKIIGA